VLGAIFLLNLSKARRDLSTRQPAQSPEVNPIDWPIFIGFPLEKREKEEKKKEKKEKKEKELANFLPTSATQVYGEKSLNAKCLN